MSTTKLEEIRCPCGEIFEAELYNSINSTEDPGLKEALLSGEINVVCCPKCNQIFYAEHFLLYHDPEAQLIAFVYPQSFETDEEFWRKRMNEDFEKAMETMPDGAEITYQPMVLFGLDRLVDIIREEEEINDEISILEYSFSDIGVDILRLKPAAARERKLPRCIPCAPGESQRTGVIKGLKKILAFNPSLQWFEKLLKLVERHKEWRVDAETLAEKSHSGRRSGARKKSK